MTTLQICIPTYKREQQLLKTIGFLDSELTPALRQKVAVRVLDNASGYDVRGVIESKYRGIQVDVNETNIGVEGSYLRLVNECSADYIYILGDDDILLPGLVPAIMAAIERSRPDYVFLNHRGRWADGRLAMDGVLPEAGVQSLLDVFNFSGTQLMFLGASVFKREKLLAAMKIYDGELSDETFPLGLALYCGFPFAKTAVIREIYLENIWGQGYWEVKNKPVFFKSVPEELIRCKQYGYSANQVMTALMFHQTRYNMPALEWLKNWFD